jgi:hypothetical protein
VSRARVASYFCGNRRRVGGGREQPGSGHDAALWRHGRQPLLLRCNVIGEGESAGSYTSSRGGGGADTGMGMAGVEGWRDGRRDGRDRGSEREEMRERGWEGTWG